MNATNNQINYLQSLADKVERLKISGFNINIPYINWHNKRFKGVTTIDADIRIKAYRDIIFCSNIQKTLLG